jgi:hypothetical protein
LKQLKKGSLYAVAVAVGALLTQLGGLAESAGRVVGYFQTPEAFVLAENTAKSAFSDQLAQRAWRRMFWAKNFRARVLTLAPASDIDLSWKNYIDADADWNANLMISIVGLQNYYGKKRSEDLEYDIQNLFSHLDEKLAELRRSDVLRGLRNGVQPGAD